MTSPFLFLPAGLALLAALPLQAANLLSDNTPRTGPASYPGDTTKTPATGRIETGATYTYLADAAAGAGVGATDPDIVDMDIGLTRLTDGYNERVGNTAIYSTWQGRQGATIVFDLKRLHAVARVSVSVREDASRGAATFQAFVSVDGVTYSPLGSWDGSKTTLDTAETGPGRNTEIVVDAASPADARYVKIYLSHWNADQTERKYRQLVVGEVAIWGDRR